MYSDMKTCAVDLLLTFIQITKPIKPNNKGLTVFFLQLYRKEVLLTRDCVLYLHIFMLYSSFFAYSVKSHVFFIFW